MQRWLLRSQEEGLHSTILPNGCKKKPKGKVFLLRSNHVHYHNYHRHYLHDCKNYYHYSKRNYHYTIRNYHYTIRNYHYTSRNYHYTSRNYHYTSRKYHYNRQEIPQHRQEIQLHQQEIQLHQQEIQLHQQEIPQHRQETTTPAGNTTTPAGNTTTPAGNTTTPAGNTTTPAGNTTTPAGNTTTPAGNTTTPAGNTTTPAGNTTTPAGNTTTPAGNTTTPAGNTTTPAGNTTTPAGNTTTPAGNTTTPAGNTTTPAGNTTTPAGNTTTPAGNTTSNSILPALNARVASLLDLQRSIVNVSKEMQTSLDIVNNISTTVNTRRHRRNVGILTALTSLLVQVEEATNRNDSANLTALAQAIKIQRSDLETLAANVRTNSSLATEIKGSVATTIQKFQTTTALLREKDNQIKSEVDILQQQISQQGGSTVLVSTANIPLVTTAMTTSTISSTNITANSTTTPAGNTTTPAGNTTTPAGNTTTPAGNTTSNSILPALNARVASLLDLQRSIVNVSKEMQTSLDIVNNISTTVNTRRHRRNVGILTALTSLLVQVEEATNRNDSANLTALAQAIKIQRSDLETLAANVRTNSSLATEIKGSVATTIQKFQTTTALLGEKDNQIKSEVDILQQQISQQGGSTVLVSTANIQVVTA
ncbi:mucin-4-like, partial [Penaeus indicus]|uniref:mucin-4-like n=1 Tax=Penaeus indicus TaxID=29960 RepID=UPI00300C3D5D